MQPTVVDLFAGCGGLALGLEQAGFKTVFVNELHQAALDTYLVNRGDSPVKEAQNNSNDILEITQRPGELEALAGRLRREHGDISLVAGGPPCQGYSGIGHRRSFVVSKEQIPSNHLYREMAKFIEAIRPRAFLFENVRGLLTSKWTPSGEQGEIWRDVRNTFSGIRIRQGRRELHYEVGHALVSAKDYGVPQNRPRVLLVGLRSDLRMPKSGIARGLLPEPSSVVPPDPIDLLGDLVDPEWQSVASTVAYPTPPLTPIQEGLRTRPDGRVLGKGDRLTDQEYSRHSSLTVAKFEYMLANGGTIPEPMRTRKFNQRVIPLRWGPGGPNITATSLPDDYVHFSLPRVPTVREWARLQTFPDWYLFSGNRTTGGRRRAGDPSLGEWAREVPKYTQIGNAVPVRLADAVGRHLLEMLS